MPDRYVRDALLRSERWSYVQPLARDLYLRLLLVADDFGVFDGREIVICNTCYPLEHIASCDALLNELHEKNLIIVFSNRTRPFIGITQWGEQYRHRRRFPAPPVNLDLPNLKVRTKYGKVIEWQNPRDWDDVSVLLDPIGRPVVPQPIEWRNVNSDWSPIIGSPQSQAPSDRLPVTDDESQDTSDRHAIEVRSKEVEGKESEVKEQSSSSKATVTGTQSPAPAPTSATTTEGKKVENARAGRAQEAQERTQAAAQPNGISWDGKAFQGLSEAQELTWQEAFFDLRVPDEIAQAAAWLQANPHAVPRDPDTPHAFLVRWMLRSQRKVPHEPV